MSRSKTFSYVNAKAVQIKNNTYALGLVSKVKVSAFQVSIEERTQQCRQYRSLRYADGLSIVAVPNLDRGLSVWIDI